MIVTMKKEYLKNKNRSSDYVSMSGHVVYIFSCAHLERNHTEFKIGCTNKHILR